MVLLKWRGIDSDRNSYRQINKEEIFQLGRVDKQSIPCHGGQHYNISMVKRKL